MRVLIVEDEPFLAEAVRDALRLEAIAADIAGAMWLLVTVQLPYTQGLLS